MLAWLLGLYHRLGLGKPTPRPRSGKWPPVERAAALRDGKRCRACGRFAGAVPLVGHHVIPFHVDPSRELDLANVITLCQPIGGGCHLRLGHTDEQGRRGWQWWNPNVIEDAARERASQA